MLLESGPTRQELRLRQAALAGVAVCLLALTMVASGMLIRSAYQALRHDATDRLELMALDDVNEPTGQFAAPRPQMAQIAQIAQSPNTPAPAPGGVAAAPTLVAGSPSLPAASSKITTSGADRRAQPARAARPARPMFDGRPIHRVGTVHMLVTAYSPDAKSCGPKAKGITASGLSVWTNAMMLAAADTRYLPFGSLLSVPGYHDARPVPVLDRGSKIKGQHIDVLFPTDAQATAWGKKYLTVTVWDYD